MKRILLLFKILNLSLAIFLALPSVSQTCSNGSFYIENGATPANPSYCLSQQVNLLVSACLSASTVVTWSISTSASGPFTVLGTSNFNENRCAAFFSFTPSAAGTYWVRPSLDATPCLWPAKQLTVANVPPPPAPTITANTNCPGVLLSINDPLAEYSKQWQKGQSGFWTAVSGETANSMMAAHPSFSSTEYFNVVYKNAACAGAPSNNIAISPYGIAPFYSSSTTSEFYFTKYAGDGTHEVKDNCNKLFAKFQGTGGGSYPTYRMKGKVTIDGSMNSYLGRPYLQRHYDFTPAPDATYPATSTRYQVSLFFSQQEFDAFNAATSPGTPKLPREPNGSSGHFDDNGYFVDAGGEIYYGHTKLRIIQGHGEPSIPGSGPESYTSAETLAGCQFESSCGGLLNITTYWNSFYNLWEVKITDLTSFSGFFITTEGATALPVTLISFKAQKQENAVVLTWQTTEETNSDRFEIEHSVNSKQWVNIGSVVSHQESNSLQNYTHTHLTPSTGENLYRLKMIDRATDRQDGSFAYSRIVSVKVEGKAKIVVFPNPANKEVHFESDEMITGYEIINPAGVTLLEKTNLKASTRTVTLPQVSSGSYFLKLYRKDKSFITKRLVIAQ